MNLLQKIFLFSNQALTTKSQDVVLLILRLSFGGALLSHGLEKWSNLSAMSETFPDPLGVGNAVSLYLAIFAEVICSLGVCIGFLYRLVLIPIIFTMGMAFFVIHNGTPFSARELAFLYLIVFAVLFVTGAGKYSVDNLLFNSRSHTNKP